MSTVEKNTLDTTIDINATQEAEHIIPAWLPDVVVKLDFGKKSYYVLEFDLQFSQETDRKNQPSGEILGGLITLTLNEPTDAAIEAWMIAPEDKRDGRISFFSNKGKIAESALLTILFKEAYCVRYQKIFNPLGDGLLTTLVISPRTLEMGDAYHENRWKK